MQPLLVCALLALGAYAVVCPRTARAQREPALPAIAGLDEFFPIPEDNPISRAKIELGRRLFFDRMLSRDARMSCASCHRPEHGFADTAARSIGVRGLPGRRNAPALINRAYGTSFFWDGRAASLEQQVLQPIQDSLELDLPIPVLLTRLRDNAQYRDAFAGVFADRPTARNVGRALASYLRSVRSGAAPLDAYRAGRVAALSESARRGLALFTGRANCSICHTGANFTDEHFHNTGVATPDGDPGRAAVTHVPVDRGAFKTPTLRDVARTAPYMHDGSMATLREVVEFYDRGGRPNPRLDPEIRPLHLTAAEKEALVAVLEALTGGAALDTVLSGSQRTAAPLLLVTSRAQAAETVGDVIPDREQLHTVTDGNGTSAIAMVERAVVFTSALVILAVVVTCASTIVAIGVSGSNRS